MEKVHVQLERNVDTSYDIVIGPDLFGGVPQLLSEKPLGNRYIIITDAVVRKTFGDRFAAALQSKGIKADILSFPQGETSKNLKTYGLLAEGAYKIGADRKSAIIALGGGVVGDMAGFVAATYMRGIPYLQIPTTLLAMVDSSIGGKAGVDLSKGKNIMGAFYQPKAVFIDIKLLKELPAAQLKNGLAEVIKHGLIADKELFSSVQKNLKKIFAKNEGVLLDIIKRNCEIKGAIVQEDEREQGKRALVNYGHTVGHALEAITHFKKFFHGEAISIGMAAAGRIAMHSGIFPKPSLDAQNNLLREAGLPVQIPPGISIDGMIELTHQDKKTVDGAIRMVLLKSIGTAISGASVSDTLLKKALSEIQMTS
ncbi:3-dehydroquinate synthase [Candidatus Woesearchaeota archaeon]|nr:3-dehydroquinate synthase [Candidatus Woesearchaeota archaeon]